jgi:uncharacterized membrane protein YphA (DoxX/SURF4 family)
MNASDTAVLQNPSFEIPMWKTLISHIAALAVAIIFLAAGLFKMFEPYQVQQLFEQLKVPAWGSMPLVIALGILETTAGLLVLIPKYRRIGAWMIVGLLVVFMGYIGFKYQVLVGQDCSCFPWLKRAVNPAFFAEDGAMLVAALAAAWLSQRSAGLKLPAIALAGAVVLSGGSFAYNMAHQSGIQVPETVTVDGKPYNLHQGRILLWFFDPQCSHCEDAAKNMSTYKWKSDVTVISFPTQQPQWAAGFLHDTKFVAKWSPDTAEMRKLFVFNYPPYGVVLDNGRVKGVVQSYDPPQPEAELRSFGLIE